MQLWLFTIVKICIASTYCPENYMYAYNNGTHCCKEPREAFRKDVASCQNRNLRLESTCCVRDRHIKCPKPPCTNSLFVHKTQGKTPLTFIKKKGIVLEHLLEQKLVLIQREDQMKVHLGFEYPKITNTRHIRLSQASKRCFRK